MYNIKCGGANECTVYAYNITYICLAAVSNKPWTKRYGSSSKREIRGHTLLSYIKRDVYYWFHCQ